MPPFISIIIPVYNVEKYICDCFESVIHQTDIDFEVIIVDDGSTDHCPEICDDYATRDSRFSVIHQKNAGVSAARNAGIKSAKGDYIMFIDPDDYIASSLISYYRSAVDKSPSSNTLICIGHKKVFSSSETKDIKLTEKEIVCTPQSALLQMLQKKSFGFVWNSLYHRNTITENHIRFNEHLHMWEDRDFNLRYFKHIREVCLIPYSLYYYRIISQSASSVIKDIPAHIESIKVCHNEMQHFLDDKNIERIETDSTLTALRRCVYNIYSKRNAKHYSIEQKRACLTLYLDMLSKSNGYTTIHNANNKWLDCLHRVVWATRCRPIIEAFLSMNNKLI